MQYSIKLQKIFTELGQRHGIDGLTLGPQSTLGLRLKDGTEVGFEYDGRRSCLHIYSIVAPLPKDKAKRLMLLDTMLELNCLEQGVSCGSLAIHRQRDTAICQMKIPLEALTASALENMLHELLACRRECAAQFERTLSSPFDKKSSSSMYSTS